MLIMRKLPKFLITVLSQKEYKIENERLLLLLLPCCQAVRIKQSVVNYSIPLKLLLQLHVLIRSET